MERELQPQQQQKVWEKKLLQPSSSPPQPPVAHVPCFSAELPLDSRVEPVIDSVPPIFSAVLL